MASAWWKLADGNYVNPAQCSSVYPQGSGTTWNLEVDVDGVGHALSGTWTSQAAALEAARKLVQGIDPGTF